MSQADLPRLFCAFDRQGKMWHTEVYMKSANGEEYLKHAFTREEIDEQI
jgi:hypothetical protein